MKKIKKKIKSLLGYCHCDGCRRKGVQIVCLNGKLQLICLKHMEEMERNAVG